MMSCAKITEELVGYLYGELRAEGIAEVDAHLGQCSACHAEFRALARTRAAFAGLPRYEASQLARNRVMVHAREAAGRAPRSVWSLFFSPAVATVCGFFVVAVLSIFVVRQAPRPLLVGGHPLPPGVASSRLASPRLASRGHPRAPVPQALVPQGAPNLQDHIPTHSLPGVATQDRFGPKGFSPAARHDPEATSQVPVALAALGGTRVSVGLENFADFLEGDPAEVEFIKARGLQENNHIREALAVYESLLKAYPRFERRDQILHAAAECLEVMGRLPEAKVYLDRLIREFPAAAGEVQDFVARLEQKLTGQ